MKKSKIIIEVLETKSPANLAKQLQELRNQGYTQGNLCTTVIEDEMFYTIICEKYETEE